jgi:hypothetical protein
MLDDGGRPAPVLVIRLGRRAMALILFGVVFLAYGLSIRGSATPGTYMAMLPGEVLALVWGGVGAVAITAGIIHPKHEWVGFVGLMVVAFLQAAGMAASGIFLDYPRAVGGCVIWLLVVGLVLLIAGWPEPPPRERVEAAAQAEAEEALRRNGKDPEP